MRRAAIGLLILVGCRPEGGDDSASEAGATTVEAASTTHDDPTSSGATSSTSPGATSPGDSPDLGAVDTLLLRGATLAGAGPADVRIAGAQIVEVGALAPMPGEAVVELAGQWIAPAFIDSHVHLVYLPTPEALADGGVAAAVDLAAPVSVFEVDLAPLRTALAGPMITAVMGYPTQSWGAGGYGLECADAAAAEAAVEQLHDLGAGVIKLAITGSAQLDDAALAAAVARAHAFELAVVAHALTEADAARAAAAGVDALAHTPTSALTPETLAAWSGRAVISTLRAFGGSQAAVANLAALREGGATVLYGTDYGNSTTPGIDRGELELLIAAGLGPAEILAAGTSTPAAYWGFEALGAVAPGKDASLLVLPSDPMLDPLVLAEPARVMLRGVWRGE